MDSSAAFSRCFRGGADMTAKLVDEVSASLSSIVDSIPKDVYPAEVGPVVFKEEPVGEDEYEGKPDKNPCGESSVVGFCGFMFVTAARGGRSHFMCV